MGKHIAFVGVGSVGGYVGGQLTRAGEDVTLVDPWSEHVDTIKRDGLHLTSADGEHVVKARALHISEAQSLIRKPVDIAIICTKSYDTAWAALLIKPYLSTQGFIVSMQNGSNEDQIASVAGWGKTVGCVLSTIGVNCYAPGRVRRIRVPSGGKYAVFRVGEIHGRVTARASELATILSAVDTAEVTRDLWSERWTKLTANTITHGLCGATGVNNHAVYLDRGKLNSLAMKLAGESIAVGRAQGYGIGTVLGMNPDLWVAAAGGDAAALDQVRDGMKTWISRMTEPTPSSIGRDVIKGRRSEIDFTNGLVAARGEEVGVPVPTHAALTAIVRRIDRGEILPDLKNIESLN